MKKIFSLCLLGFFLFSLMVSPGLSQKASDILEKMIDAQGGRKNLEKVKDMTLTGSMELITMGMSGSRPCILKSQTKCGWILK